jgi:hypothetical protein
MSPLNLSLEELIERLETDLFEGSTLEKVSEAQLRSHSMAALGDELVGHYVARAKQEGASWSEIGEAIGVSKQAAQQRHSSGAFEHFTDRARHSIVLAQEIARGHRHEYIGTEHLLLGLVAEPKGLASLILADRVGSAEAVRAAIESRLFEDGKRTPRGHIPFTPRSKAALQEAVSAARDLGHAFVGTEHVLLGLVSVPQGVAQAALLDMGFDKENLTEVVRARVAELLAQHKDESP